MASTLHRKDAMVSTDAVVIAADTSQLAQQVTLEKPSDMRQSLGKSAVAVKKKTETLATKKDQSINT